MQVDSKQQMLEVGQILEAESQQGGEQVPLEMSKAAFAKLASMPENTLLRYGNTIFICMTAPRDTSIAKVVVINADTAPNVATSFMQLFDNAMKKGWMQLQITTDDPTILSALQSLEQKYTIKMTEGIEGTTVVGVQLGASQPALGLGAQYGMV
jgi:hypothetical protein